MTRKSKLLGLLMGLALGACAGGDKEKLHIPDTGPGDRLEAEYFLGEWCTNREMTSVANSEAGHSALVNLSKLFWKFNDGGEWKNSASGYVYALQGDWQLQAPDQLVLAPMRGKTVIYAASFRNGGIELVLKDQQGQFQIMSRCD